ncbi:hypothetical protein OG782_37530 (plasmid) [Streptomyces sp. NBC_00876]|nr:hypothetical protein OG782_37530 [Streptomyces sp. NBC_00876]
MRVRHFRARPPTAHSGEGERQVNDEPAQEAQSDEDIGWPRR